MIDAAEESGELQPGGTIVEPTAATPASASRIVAQQRGYNCVFVCPDKVAADKINVLRAYGAEVVVCPTAWRPRIPRVYYPSPTGWPARSPAPGSPNQYANPDNPLSHYESTGPEIWEQTDGRITHFVAGVGTGGTISGTGRYLKERPTAASRSSAPTRRARSTPAAPAGRTWSRASARTSGRRRTTGPSATRSSRSRTSDSFEMTRRLAREEGLLVGGSCGMAVVAALEVARNAGPDDVVVVLLPGQRSRLPLEDLQRRVDGPATAS